MDPQQQEIQRELANMLGQLMIEKAIMQVQLRQLQQQITVPPLPPLGPDFKESMKGNGDALR